MSASRAATPAWFHGVSAATLLTLIVLCARGRVFIDQVWITEWGRRLLEPQTDHSMFMLVDGTTLPPPAWLGPLLAELLFRLTDDLIAFRLLAAGAAIGMAYGVLRLALRCGVPVAVAAFAATALLLDPTMIQSVVVGRPDTLAIAALTGGLLLASAGSDRGPGSRGPQRVAAGYALAAMSAAIWSGALLLAPLAFLHWLQGWRRSGETSWPVAARIGAFVVVPALVLAATVLWPLWQAHTSAAPQAVAWTRSYGDSPSQALFIGLQMVAVSLPLLILGSVAVFLQAERRLALWLGGGMLLVLASGFYPFRIPYLLVWASAAVVLAARDGPDERVRVLERTGLLVAAVSGVLMLLRILLASGNQAPPSADGWLARLPAGTRVADFGWDFYVDARRRGVPVMRAFPGLPDDAVSAWLRRAQPDVIVRPALPQNAWIMIDDADRAFADGRYCRQGYIDWTGEPVSADLRVRQPPTPLTWRLGMFRDYGPYVWWAPCDAQASGATGA